MASPNRQPSSNMDTEPALLTMGMDYTVPAQQPLSPTSLILFPRGFEEIQPPAPDGEETGHRSSNDGVPSQPSALTTVLHNTVRPQTKEHWDSWKPIIQRLYCDYNLPLGDLITFMKEQFCFLATRKMYRTQFTRWGWRKYGVHPPERSHGHRGTAIRSTRRRAAVLAELTNTPLIYAPPMDALSRHRQQVAQTVLPFVTSALQNVDLFQNSRLWGLVLDFLHDTIDLIQHRINAFLSLSRKFDRVDWHLARCELDALLVFCLMQPYFLWHLRYQGPAVSQFLDIYINHVAELVEVRVGRQHPIAALMMGLRYVYQQVRGEWSSFIGPLISEVDTVLVRELDEISTGASHNDTLRWERRASTWGEPEAPYRTKAVSRRINMPSLSEIYGL